MKQFKHHKNLIRYAIKRAIHRIDVLEPEAHAEELMKSVKKSDWLQWATQLLKGKR